MQITRVKCPSNKYTTKCPDVTKKEGITVHNTYNDASAMAEISYMLGRPEKVSFHVAVDDYRVVEGLDFNRSCYAAGDGRYGFGNAKTINIEICYSKSGGERFYHAEDLAAEYIAMLLKQYGWGIDKVGTHQMRSGKYCPHRTLDMGWQRFLDKIKKYLNGDNNKNNTVIPDKEADDMVVWSNGSTSEPVYQLSNLTNRIGKLSPREKCLGKKIRNGCYLVLYNVDGKSYQKCGFVRYHGGLK